MKLPENPFEPIRECADEDGAITKYIGVEYRKCEQFKQAILKTVIEWLEEHRHIKATQPCPECGSDYGITKEEVAELRKLIR
jgi:hypothetical protein